MLLDESEIQQATEVLEAAVPEAEAVGDEPVLAATLAYLARAHMRGARQARAVEAADRALAIAERLNLEPIIAEALVNKGSAINLMGRRREAAALEEAALTLARRTGDRGLEIRIRNNLASAIIVDDPIRATRMYQEARELAADLGDRGMYNWLSGLIALNTFTMGGDVDAEIAILRDALDAATLRPDRIRLRMIRGVLEAQRGVAIPELRTEVEELVGDSTDPEQLFSRHMARAFTALMIGNGRESYDEAMAAFELTPQNPEVPLGNAIRSAVLLRDAERAATVAGHITALGQSGDLDRSSQLGAQAVVAEPGADAEVEAERFQLVELFLRAGGARHARAQRFGSQQGRHAHAGRHAGDEQPLALLQVALLHQHVVDHEEGQRRGGGLFPGHVRRHRDRVGLVHQRVFGKAGRQPSHHPSARSFDLAGALGSADFRRTGLGEAVAQELAAVETGGLDAHQELPGPGLRLRRFAQFEVERSRIEEEGTHGGRSVAIRRPLSPRRGQKCARRFAIVSEGANP